ncbi:oligosaccharide flippase family protein [Telmatobacter sp. DSM 110680]|uniref:Oligosaccharide flippase family protein n=1 Tax=Telmatobacter sp. DSM 110680 TaxID=3036704 RepID=A0AAU7DF13_9BACT
MSVFRLRSHDTSTEGGRSKERLRRAGLTTVSAGAARVIGLLVSLVTLPLTFKYLGPERYGLWMVLISIISAMGFADLGIGNGLVNAISEAYGKDDRNLAREYVTSAFVMMLGIALFLSAAGAAAFPFMPWMRLFNVESAALAVEGSHAILVLYAWFVISIPIGIITRAQSGLQQGYIPQVVGALGSVLTLIALLLAIRLHGSLAWLVFASTMGSVTATAFNGWLLFYEHPWLLPARHAYRRSAASKILKLGLMFFVLQCAVTIGYTSDNIVITQILGAAAVAAYAVPQKLFSFVGLVVGVAITPLWPAYGEALARGDVSWVRRVFFSSLWLTFVISGSFCTLLVLTGPWILRVFFGRSLHAPLSLLIVLGLWGVVAAVSASTSILLNGAGVLRVQAIAAVIASLTNLALSIILTRRFGVIGVCLGSIITQLAITFPIYAFIIRDLFGEIAKAKFENIEERRAASTETI